MAAVYFLSVVLLEVPSGWASDRFGRVHLLRLAAASWVAAYCLFLLADAAFGANIWLLSSAQVLVALGFASLSGTDASFHYDTLEAADRAKEFERSEATISRNAFIGTTIAAIVGGGLGSLDLVFPFVASALAALYQLRLATRMVEPARALADTSANGHDVSAKEGGFNPVADSLKALLRKGTAGRALRWLFLFMIVQQPLEGMALDLMQPWLSRLADTSNWPVSPALASGFMVAILSLVGAVSAAKAHALRLRLGLRTALSALAAIEAAIIAGMALFNTVWLLPLLALRSTQAAAAPVLTTAAVAPMISRSERATFLSLASLAGRLAYGLTLLSLGQIGNQDTMFRVAAALGFALFVLLFVAGLTSGRLDDKAQP